MDFLIEFLKLDLLVAQPQGFVYWLFCFSFLHPQPHKMIKRIFLLSFIHNLYTDISILVLPLHWHVINSYVTSGILLFIIFRDLNIRKKIFLLIGSWLLFIVMDTILMIMFANIAGITMHSEVVRESLPVVIKFLYPLLILVFIASWLIRKRGFLPVKRFLFFLLEGEKLNLIYVIALITIEIVLLGFSLISYVFVDTRDPLFNQVLIYAVIGLSLLVLFIVSKLLIRSKELAINSTQEVYVEDINQMFASIRGQRHDFINHLQVIHSMSQMRKQDELQTYVHDLVQETQEVNDIVNHRFPALAAFFQAKTAVAVAKGIAFSFELPDQFVAHEPSVRTIDMIKILGNLVDNAFDEVILLPAGNRLVHCSVHHEDNYVLIAVANRGAKLTEEQREKIFTLGYSTKTDGKHSGLGLAIVAERIKYYGGTIELFSDEHIGTVFKVSIPIRENPV